jgi:uncharacterized protein (DUF433 family)
MKTSVTIRDTGVSVAQVLKLISQGYSSDQILKANPRLIMSDIMAAADLARQVIESLQDEYQQIEIHHEISFAFSRGQFVSMEKLRERYPRAYIEWSDREDQQLADMFQKGATIDGIARQHQRQPGAIQARLRRLKLIE